MNFFENQCCKGKAQKKNQFNAEKNIEIWS